MNLTAKQLKAGEVQLDSFTSLYYFEGVYIVTTECGEIYKSFSVLKTARRFYNFVRKLDLNTAPEGIEVVYLNQVLSQVDLSIAVDGNGVSKSDISAISKPIKDSIKSLHNKILGTQESFMSIYNNDGTYYSGSVARMRIAAIPKYPDIVFQTASLYTTNFYLPENSSSYAIKQFPLPSLRNSM